MTSTGATSSTTPPLSGSGAGGLPPTLPGTSTAPATSTPATAGSSTSFEGHSSECGKSFPMIEPPAAPKSDPPAKATGGGSVAGASGDGIKSVLDQLTTIIGKLGSLIGGVSGGGAPAKTPEQTAPPKTPAQDATQVAGANGAPAKDATQVAGANGAPAKDATQVAGAQGKECDMPGHKAAAEGGGASTALPPSTVAGANGAGAANAAEGAASVQGGGGPALPPGGNEALLKALQGVIEALNALIKALSGTIGGGPKDPVQKKPEQKDDTKVGGEHGPGKDPTQKPVTPDHPPLPPAPPTSVGGEHGPGQSPEQAPPKVGGASGGPVQQSPEQKPEQKPVQTPPPVKPPVVEPPAVAGANGGPVQQSPEQTPVQTPVQKPTQVGGARGGNVTLDNDDERWSAKLTSKGGKSENSVEVWGDPHIVINIDGQEKKFDIGFGAGSATLFDGTKVTWDTYDKGADHQFILRDFKIDAAGDDYDRSVTTRDRDGDKGDQMGLTTSLTDEHLRELAAAFATMEGAMSDPLKNPNWVSPAFKDPTQK